MSRVRFPYDPFIEFERLFDDAFSARFRPSGSTQAVESGSRIGIIRPNMDLIESKDKNEVTAIFDLPDFEKGDVSIDMQQGRLIISGEPKATKDLQEGEYVVRERYGKFSRTLQLPMGTKPEDIKAKMEGGILKITFPKVERQPESKIVPVT
ncbi:small heat shock protein [Suillus ampliporus]|nr:small heat shock protein [Suillus ampliporus]